MNERKISNLELMRKMNLFMRRARMDRPPMPPRDPHGMEHPPMPPFEPHGMDRPPMPPFDPHGMAHPPMPPHEPHGMDHPPMPPFGQPRMNRPPHSREHILLLMAENPDGIRQKALSEKLGINQSSTSELIDKLENGGYLARKVDPDDRRATLLFLTELGSARAAEIQAEQEAMGGGIFDRLTAEERQQMSDLLDKLLEEPEAE